MAIADTITSMQTHTTNAYNVLNYATDLTGTNKNLSNLKQCIFDGLINSMSDTLNPTWKNLPKLTTTPATSLSINNTIEAPMRTELGASALEQTTYTGSNKFDITNTNQATITTSDNVNYTYVPSSTTIDYSINGEANTSYTFTANVSTTIGADFYIYFLYGDGTSENVGSLSGSGTQSKTITKSSNASKTLTGISLRQYNIAKYNNYKINSPMLNKGSTATTYEPYCGGTASPNPTYPQDIHTISGSNSIVVEGKNILNVPESLSVTGNTTINVKVPANTEFTISMQSINLGGSNASLIQYRDANGSTISTNAFDSNNLSHTRTFTTEMTSIRLYSQNNYNNSQGITSTFNKMMVRTTGDNTYTPYVSQTNTIDLSTYNLGSIGNYENKFIRSDGKNLFDETITPENYFYNSSGEKTSDSNNEYINQEIDNVTYNSIIVSYGSKVGSPNVRVCEYNSSGTFITRTLTITNNQVININSATTKIIFSANADSSNNFINLMINKGTTALPYVPYEKGWYYKEGIGKVVLDGNETISEPTLLTNTARFGITNVLTGGGSTSGMSDYFTYTMNYNLDSEHIYTTTTGVFLFINQSLVSTKAGLQTWLGNNNVSVYYPMATPTYTKLTDTTLINQLENIYKNMLSYKGTTNISQVNNDLPFTLSVSAIEDLS